MLKLTNVKKTYVMGDSKVEALKGLTINFRKNEFVSILGPSGCGKTTLLNLIGGLDKYTDGDLIINQVSTKKYTDRDWDIYRNHRIGFIFQSYNLIPHQTILENVELALTIAGIEKNERVERAKRALDRVGLTNQYHKKPNQLSGGQCQRVAIARALVNEPEILLADEPTGALDTVTSVQIMDLIKEISSEKLVIMVTHNPELAEKYSTRIVKLLDGEIFDDSNPCSDEEEVAEIEKTKQIVSTVLEENSQNDKKEKAKMSFWTAFKLSARNLISKLKRTLMVGLAGSIGIIGVSLVLSLSSGINDYIDDLQEDMLSGNPIVISEQAYDINALMGSMTMMEKEEILKEAGIVSVNSILKALAERSKMMKSIMVTNEITKNYIDYLNTIPKEYLETISYGYGLDIHHSIYTDFNGQGVDKNQQLTSLAVIQNTYQSLLVETEFKESATFISTLSQSMSQSLDNEDYILKQYDLKTGKMAKEKNEIMIVISKDSQLSDLTLAQLGYYGEEEFMNMAYNAFSPELADKSKIKEKFSYEELLGKTFVWYPNDEIYTKNNGEDRFKPVESNPYFYTPYMDKERSSESKALELKVVGILQPKENMNYGSLSNGFFYTPALTQYIMEQNKESEITKYVASTDAKSITSVNAGLMTMGVTYDYFYGKDENGNAKKATGLVGRMSTESMFMGMLGGSLGGSGDSQTSSIKEMRSLSLRDLGGETLPSSISIYPINFELKEHVLTYLDAWNNEGNIVLNGVTLTKEDRAKITYTDALSIVISMISTMIQVISTALISFTAISLVVSTVMIGIITYVSVVERTKEIGVIRSLGGRKKDVAHLFNAETFIIGGVAGVLGIGITLLIGLIANLIIGAITNIYTLVSLKWYHAVIMIAISILLTSVSGLIPAKSAARMDPVNALRTE